MPICREFHFTGSVQGVGFRWTAKRLADRLGLAGWVRNNRDGSVTVVAMGPEDDVAELLTGLDAEFGPYILGVESKDASSEELSGSFDIVR